MSRNHRTRQEPTGPVDSWFLLIVLFMSATDFIELRSFRNPTLMTKQGSLPAGHPCGRRGRHGQVEVRSAPVARGEASQGR